MTSIKVKSRESSDADLREQLSDLCKRVVAEKGMGCLSDMMAESLITVGYRTGEWDYSVQGDIGRVSVSCDPVCLSRLH